MRKNDRISGNTLHPDSGDSLPVWLFRLVYPLALLASPPRQCPCPPLFAEPPPVTIQLPIFNEKYVVARLINAAASQNYPPERLHIQVIDDSTDDTTAIATEIVEAYKRKGMRIDLLHRDNRQGVQSRGLKRRTAAGAGGVYRHF
ncbi:MAG: glycosyltransferase [Chloroflexi bacterium]|nr:glycosyltransferase [Chloroflexota bacterium]